VDAGSSSSSATQMPGSRSTTTTSPQEGTATGALDHNDDATGGRNLSKMESEHAFKCRSEARKIKWEGNRQNHWSICNFFLCVR
jgi:hypothetical protein